MRFALVTVGLLFSSQALACGMYIPPELKVASIGSIMEEVDDTDEGTLADVWSDEAAAPNLELLGALEEVPVQNAGFQGVIGPVEGIEPVKSRKELRREARELRKAQKHAANS